jgi:hypothetical protein
MALLWLWLMLASVLAVLGFALAWYLTGPRHVRHRTP